MRPLQTLLFALLLTAASLAAPAQDGSREAPVPGEIRKPPYEGKPYRLFTSTRDYSKLAAAITDTCTTDYAKLRAIYGWICDHIDYDLTYRIHCADSCYQMRRGVCQAYCELYYRIAEAAGQKVEVITGLTKDSEGRISPNGHTWLFAYTRPGRGILMDPTWGAGNVVDGHYRKNDDKWGWFGVSPEWMLLSHYPDSAHYQLVDRPLSLDEFARMPYVRPLLRTYGISELTLFRQALGGSLSVPFLYNGGEGKFRLVDIPLTDSLSIGRRYTFRVRMNSSREFAIVNNPVLCRKAEWCDEGDGVYSVDFMPRAEGKVAFSLKNEQVDSRWELMVKYAVRPPTAADWALVERDYPLCVPDALAVENLNADGWARCGVDGHRLLQLIREQHVTSLPIIYQDRGQRFDIVSVPMNRTLHVGQAYTFSIRPKSGKKWVMVANSDQWHTQWAVADDGTHTLTVIPDKPGVLRLYVDLDGDGQYWTCLGYVVE